MIDSPCWLYSWHQFLYQEAGRRCFLCQHSWSPRCCWRCCTCWNDSNDCWSCSAVLLYYLICLVLQLLLPRSPGGEKPNLPIWFWTKFFFRSCWEKGSISTDNALYIKSCIKLLPLSAFKKFLKWLPTSLPFHSQFSESSFIHGMRETNFSKLAEIKIIINKSSFTFSR